MSHTSSGIEHIETPRLVLRPFEDGDARAAYHNSSRPIVAHFMSDMVLKDERDALGWIRMINGKLSAEKPFMALAITLKELPHNAIAHCPCPAVQQPEQRDSHGVKPLERGSGGGASSVPADIRSAPIGLIGVAPKAELGGEVEILYAIADEHQGNGYATEAAKAAVWWAFEKAGLTMLSAIVKPANKASERVIQKLGFMYCDTRQLDYDGSPCMFDYYRLYRLDSLPGPNWDLDTLYMPEAMDAFFDRRAQGYDAHMLSNSGAASYERLLDALPHTDAPLRVLDLGCGTGLELEYLFRAMPNAHVTCVDIAAGMLDVLCARYANRSGQIERVEASYMTWAYPARAFDLVLSCNTMHHLFEEEKLGVYKRILGALKPGGCYVEDDFMVDPFMAPQYRARYQRIIRHARGDAAGGAYHIDIPMTVDAQVSLLRGAGFETVEVVYENIRNQGSGAILRADAP